MTARLRITWLLVAAALQGCAKQEAAGVFKTALPAVKSSTTVEAFRLTSEYGDSEYPSDYEVVAGPVPLADEQIEQLRAILLDPSSYARPDGNPSCIIDYGVRFRFLTNADVVDVLLCFQCHFMAVYRNDEIVTIRDFSPVHAQLAAMVSLAFPEDPAFQPRRSRPKAGLRITDPAMWPLWCGMTLMVFAAVWNQATRKVPNKLTFWSVAVGLLLSMALSFHVAPPEVEPGGFVSSFLSLLIVFVILLPAYIYGGDWVPAGCVKMQCAFATWVGCAAPLGQSLRVCLLGTLAGAIISGLALLVAIRLWSEPVESRPPGSTLPAQPFLTLGTLGVVFYEFWP